MIQVFRNIFPWPAMLMACFMLALGSCKSTKTIQTAISKKDTTTAPVLKDTGIDSAMVIEDAYKKVKQTNLLYVSFTAKIKVDYFDKASGKEQGATAFIRLRKDSLLWVSLTGALGVEGFRALIRPDSVILLDKLEKTVSRRSIASLQELTGLPLNFTALQDLIVGNPVYFSDSIVSFETNGNTISLMSTGEYFKHFLSFDTTSQTILQSKIDDIDQNRNRTCFIHYADYLPAQGVNFSTRRDITVTEKSSLNIKLEYKQYSFDELLTFPFSIPKNYREK